MVNGTRSGLRNKDGENCSRKNADNREGTSNASSRTATTSGSKRPAKGGSSGKMTLSSPSIRKSERLEKWAPSAIPITRKSERLVNHSTPSPLRRSDRAQKHSSSSPLGSNHSGKIFSSADAKKRKEKKEKSIKQLTMEPQNVISSEKYEQGSIGPKRKRMDAGSYKSLFKSQKRRYSTPDSDDKLERQDRLSQIDSVENGGSDSKLVGDTEDGGHKYDHAISLPVGSRVVIEHPREPLRAASEAAPPRPVPDGDTCSESAAQSGKSKSPSCSRDIRLGKDVCALDLEDACLTPANLEKHDIVGNCVVCYKKRSLAYDSPKEELCSCTPVKKDAGDVELAFNSGSVGSCDHITGLNETLSDVQTDNNGNICVKCKQPRELLYCCGKGCRRCYHLSCLDPILYDAPPGIWYCPYCTKKKIEFGVYTVTTGIESIWDAREVVVTDAKETRRQKQYLVKYQGLAHAYNHWIPESQLLLETPSLVAEYNAKNQRSEWNLEWTVPSRLLRKRPFVSVETEAKCSSLGTGSISDCQYEWLVKWCGLDYVHATWELENSNFLQSPQGQKLIREYGIRYEKAKKAVAKTTKGSFVKLKDRSSAGGSTLSDDCSLQNVNKLRELWYKSKNAVVSDEQERFANVIFFILSLSNDHQPFLITSTSEALPQWKDEFLRLAPSVDVVVYKGNINTRKSIRTLEFHNEDKGAIMLQVLLSPIEVVIEDLQFLNRLKWKVIVIDDCQRASPDLEQMKLLETDMRLLLFGGPIKDTVAEYSSLLSLLGSPDDPDKACGLKSDAIDNLVEFKELLSRFTAYSKLVEYLVPVEISNLQLGQYFVEYLVPVEISNLQLEQYCGKLLANAPVLCSNCKTDKVGAFKEILMTLRKCCDHPYIVASSLQSTIIEGLTQDQVLEIGIAASGKLQLLHGILSKIRNQQLRALVLFQSITGSGEMAIGDILDDFVRGKFGPNSYERIDACLSSSKKQAALNRFNNIGGEHFVFLLENRACQPSIKLSVDIVVIFNSDWNSANDLKALQRLSIQSRSERIYVFRLYSSCTIEEKALILGKQNLNHETSLQMIKFSSSFLMWGASYLFSRLEEYHAVSSTNNAADISHGQKLLCDGLLEVSTILSGCSRVEPVISRVFRNARASQSYSILVPLIGERKVQLTDVEEPHIFWKKLLEGKAPKWKFSLGQTRRSRKRVQYAEEASTKPDCENDDTRRKHKKLVSTSFSAAPVQLEQEESQVAGSNKETSMAAATNQSWSSPVSVSFPSNKLDAKNASRSLNPQGSFANRNCMAHLQVKSPSDEQKSLHASVKEEMVKLCEVLKLSKEVEQMIDRFLEYVMENHHVHKEPASILQAFQMSLCWIAASILKLKIDKKDSLELAKRILDFKCTGEEANSVYWKLRLLKKTFLQLPGVIGGSISQNFKSTSGNIVSPSSANAEEPSSGSFDLQNVKANQELAQAQEPNNKPTDLEKGIKKIQKICDKRMSKLHLEHQMEMQKFHKMWAEKKGQLEKGHRDEVTFIRAIHGNGAMGMDKLKMSDTEFAKKMAEHEHLKEVQLKELEAKHSAATEEERKRIANWLAKAKSCSDPCRTVNKACIRGSEPEDEIGLSNTAITVKGTGNGVFLSGLNIEEQGLDRIVSAAETSGAVASNVNSNAAETSDVVLSNLPLASAVEAIGCKAPAETAPTLLNSNAAETSNAVPSNLPVASDVEAIGCKAPAETAPTLLNSNVAETSDAVPSNLPVASAVEVIGCKAPVETGPTLLNSNAVETSDAVPSNFPVASAVEAIGCKVPAETAPTLLKSNAEKESETQMVESVPGAEQHKEHRHSSQTVEDIPTFDKSTENHVTDEILSTGKNNKMPSGDSCNTGCETGYAHTIGISSLVNISTSEKQSADEIPVTNQRHGMATGSGDAGLEMGPDHALDIPVEFSVGNDRGNVTSDIARNQKDQLDVDLTDSLPSDAVVCLQNKESMDMQNEDIPATGNQTTTVGAIHSAPFDAGSSQGPAAEEVHQGHSKESNSLQNSAVFPQLQEESVEVSHQTVSQDAENLALHPRLELLDSVQGQNHPDLLTNNRADREPNGELSAHTRSGEAQVSQNAAELPNQAVSQSGPNPPMVGAGHLQLYGAHRVASRNATLPSNAEPLQNELERICKEMEQVNKLHDSTKIQLKSDCEKEIEEMAAQIRINYEAKLKDAETVFVLKQNELESKQSKVLMNKMLAEAFKAKCMDLRSSGISGGLQAPSSFMQHLRQLSLRPTMRHTPVISQHVTNLPVQSTHRSPGNFSRLPARPPLINSVTPAIVNARVGGEVRAPAPHLQPFRPPACMSSANMSSLPCNPNQQVPVTSSSLPPLQALLTSSQFSQPNLPPPALLPPVMINQSGSGNQLSESEGGVQLCSHNSSLSALELLRNVHNQPSGHAPNLLPCSPCTNAGAVDLASGVVCLSDDDD